MPRAKASPSPQAAELLPWQHYRSAPTRGAVAGRYAYRQLGHGLGYVCLVDGRPVARRATGRAARAYLQALASAERHGLDSPFTPR